MHNSLDDLQVETHSDYHSLSPSQCDLAFDIFPKFSRIENPFLSSNSQSFDNMRQCLTEIRELLNHHMRKSQSRPHPAFLPSCMTKKEKIHLAQLDAAAKGVFVLQNDVDTIDRLVTRLHAEVENDMLLIHIGLERGRDKYSIQEILKQFLRNRSSFTRQLVDLEEHLILCFATINTRLLLLQEIDMLENPV